MAVFSITSTNPKFSFLLKKNPASGLFGRGLRSGYCFGWFGKPKQVENDTFCFFFRDGDHDYSYPRVSPQGVPLIRQESYTNIDQYGAPPFLANAIREFSQHLLNKEDPEDVVADHVVEIPFIRANARYLEFFRHHYRQIQLEAKEVAPHHFSIRLQGSVTLQWLLHYLSWFSIMNSIRLSYGVPGEGETQKYLRSLQILDAPYFMRYLFKCNFLRGKEIFNQRVADLARSDTHRFEFVQGWNSAIRYRWVRDLLDRNRDVLDVGCGEGAFFGLSKDLDEGRKYRAVDRDPEVREEAAKKIRLKQFTVELLEEIPADIEGNQILLIEMIEHMELSEAVSFLQGLIAKKPHRILLTTPNKTFNQHYFEEVEQSSRHEDHKFEFNRSELSEFLSAFPGVKEIVPVGDSVDGEPSNFGVIWTF